jgi:hypothetical protein
MGDLKLRNRGGCMSYGSSVHLCSDLLSSLPQGQRRKDQQGLEAARSRKHGARTPHALALGKGSVRP